MLARHLFSDRVKFLRRDPWRDIGDDVGVARPISCIPTLRPRRSARSFASRSGPRRQDGPPLLQGRRRMRYFGPGADGNVAAAAATAKTKRDVPDMYSGADSSSQRIIE
jgi:hypothetical protein